MSKMAKGQRLFNYTLGGVFVVNTLYTITYTHTHTHMHTHIVSFSPSGIFYTV